MSHTTEERLQVRGIIEGLRASVAAACAAGLLLGLAAGLALGRVNGPALIGADAEQQLQIATTLLTAVLTVTGVVLSILVVGMQLASQQYSPRTIRTTFRDRRLQVALACLFAYLGFMLGVIEAVDSDVEDPLGLALGAALSVVALAVVAYIVQRVTEGLQSDQMVATVGRDTLEAVERIAERDEEEQENNPRSGGLEEAPDDAVILHATATGYLQDVSLTQLARALHERGVRVWLAVGVGDFVPQRTGLAWAMPAEIDQAEVEQLVCAHLRLGTTRTTEREVGSGIQQLIDIALRALSPAINDPYTAVQAINTTTFVLQRLGQRRQSWLVGRCDGEQVVTIPRPLVWDHADLVVDSVRRVAGRYPQVLTALVTLLRGLVAIRPADGDRAEAHLEAIMAEAEAAGLLSVDLQALRARVEQARRELKGRAADTPPEPDEDAPDP